MVNFLVLSFSTSLSPGSKALWNRALRTRWWQKELQEKASTLGQGRRKPSPYRFKRMGETPLVGHLSVFSTPPSTSPRQFHGNAVWWQQTGLLTLREGKTLLKRKTGVSIVCREPPLLFFLYIVTQLMALTVTEVHSSGETLKVQFSSQKIKRGGPWGPRRVWQRRPKPSHSDKPRYAWLKQTSANSLPLTEMV